MGIEQIINLIINNGAAIGCLAYFMWFNSTVIKDLRDLITGIKEDQTETNVRLENIEMKLELNDGGDE